MVNIGEIQRIVWADEPGAVAFKVATVVRDGATHRKATGGANRKGHGGLAGKLILGYAASASLLNSTQFVDFVAVYLNAQWGPVNQQVGARPWVEVQRNVRPHR